MNNNNQNIQEMSGFQWWAKKRKSTYFQNFLLFSTFLLFFVFFVFLVGFENVSARNMVILGIIILIFVMICCGQFKQWRKSFNLQPDNYWIGTINEVDFVLKSAKRRSKSYRIVADVNGKLIEGVCLRKTYHMAEIGQEILLFTLGGETVFCVHPEM